jgi:predicted permease
MSGQFRAVLIRLGQTLRPGARSREFDAELESHLQMHIDDGVRAGLTRVEARRRALIKLGGIEPTRQAHVEWRGIRWIEQFGQDLRYGIRGLQAGTSWTAIGMIAVAIGLTTAMFSIVDALLLRPVPFRDSDRLAYVIMRGRNGGSRGMTPAVIEAWRRVPLLEGVEGIRRGDSVLESSGGPVVRTSAEVTPGLFTFLGVTPLRGRVFDDRDARRPAAESVVMISEELWRGAFAGTASIVGMQIAVDRGTATIVGVLPRGFRFPDWNTEVWRPLDLSAPTGTAGLPVAYVRWKAGIQKDEVLRVVADVARTTDPVRHKEQYATAGEVSGFALETYYRKAVSFLGGGVALVFLALCANVASLLLGRFTRRQREFRLCTALGASRGRLLSRSLVECGVLASVGVIGGLAMASMLVSLAGTHLPEAFLSQTLHPLRIDARSFLVATLGGALAAIGAGLVPCLAATSRRSLGHGRFDGRVSTASKGARVLERSLLIGELALACTLLLGATMLTRSFVDLIKTDRGFSSAGLMTAHVWIGAVPREARPAMAQKIEELVRTLPGVQRVAWSGGAPMSPPAMYHSYRWQVDGADSGSESMLAANRVGPEYFQLYGLRTIRGRTFSVGEDPNHVVIDESAAAKLWRGTDPIGQTLTGGPVNAVVVGVVKDVRASLVEEEEGPTIYVPFDGLGVGPTLGIQCAATCPSEAVVRHRLLQAGAGPTVDTVHHLDKAISYDVAQPRATAAVGALFSVVALLAAAGGLFSVLSYAVSRRRREFGIRAALGASRRSLAALVLRDGLLVTLAGLAIGSLAAWLIAQPAASVQFGITVDDPLIWLTVVGVLALTTILAAWRPLRVAMRVDPVMLLREE